MKPAYKDVSGKGNTSYVENHKQWLLRYGIKPSDDKHYVKIDDTDAYYGRVEPWLPSYIDKGYTVEKEVVKEKIFVVSCPMSLYNEKIDIERAESRARQVPAKRSPDMIAEVKQRGEGISVDLLKGTVEG